MSLNPQYREIQCRVCGSNISPKSSMEKHCSWQCRLSEITNQFRGHNGCWNWPLSVNPETGYGQFNIGNGRIMSSHRAVMLLTHGNKFIEGKFVCHSCDNRRCINPTHLFIGSPQDNTNDMMNKGRYNKNINHPKGVDHPLVKDITLAHRLFSAKEALEIKSSIESSRKIAHKYGCSKSAILNVINGGYDRFIAESAKKTDIISRSLPPKD